MQIRGFRIQVSRVPVDRARARPMSRFPTPHPSDLADVGRFPWLPLDPEPRPELLATLEASVANGSYWIPAPEISRLLVDDHITVWP